MRQGDVRPIGPIRNALINISGAATVPMLDFILFARKNSLKPFVFCLLLLLSTIASANAAMGLALELFDFKIWAVYVVATVFLEAWIIGPRLGFSLTRSLGLSFVANLLTAFCCGGSGLFAPFLHSSFVGTNENPNPFGNVVAILCVFGLISAIFESMVWCYALQKRARETQTDHEKTVKYDPTWKVLQVSLLAHAAGVPLALVILLAPSHPYGVTENRAWLMRRSALTMWIHKAIETRIAKDGRIPPIHSIQELLDGVPRVLEREPDPTIEFYEPTYGRFATGDDRSHPWKFEFNPRTVTEDSKDPWVVRIHSTTRPGDDYQVGVRSENTHVIGQPQL